MKTFKKFIYNNLSFEDFVKLVDEILPITLRYNSNLVNRVSNRYPHVNKYKIANVILTFFKIYRANLLKNNIINLSSFLQKTHLFLNKAPAGFVDNCLYIKVKSGRSKKVNDMIDSNEFIDKLKTFDSKAVCAVIVTSKYFGEDVDTIRSCMQILSERRNAGENFDFESFIDDETRKLPKLNNKMDLKDVMSNFKM